VNVRLHHIALGAHDVECVAAFYRDVLGLSEYTRHCYPDGSLRSIWLSLGDALLMVEHTADSRAPVDGVGAGLFLIALTLGAAQHADAAAQLARLGVAVESRSRFSLYFRDPEGNRVALSSWPDEALP
jgi:catechol-2,3-dioxygenase